MKLWLINPEKEILIKVSKLESVLQCPVCLETVRDLPVPCCQAGHIICKECKANPTLLQCPTCRRRYPDEEMTNSAIASMIDVLPHKCKFSRFGCKEKLGLDDLIKHEAKCPERTVICPYRSCKQKVQLKMFSEHMNWSLESNCGSGNSMDLLTKLPFTVIMRTATLDKKADSQYRFCKFKDSSKMC